MNYVIPFTSNIDISPNEVIVNPVLNRNFEKLLSNDQALDILRTELDKDKIKPFTKGQSYKLGELIWYRTKSPFTNSVNLYLLKNDLDNNTNEPKLTYYNDRYSFIESGWIDMNEFNSTLENDLSGYVIREAHKTISLTHEDSDNHKYGELRSLSGSLMEKKFLKKDLSNIDPNREHLFYPYETVSLSTSNVITNGFYRKWDNGLLEYSITFKLGYFGEKRTLGLIDYEVYKCNTLSIENNQYINDSSDADIFIENTNTEVFINNHFEINRSDYINSYSSTLIFEYPFIDNNYMIFTGNIRNSQRDLLRREINQSLHALTFTNKKTNSICPVYILQGVDNDGENNGLLANTFHCYVIGKWK